MQLMNPGEKIKKIRKQYKINQKSLTTGITSISMLSYFENGKYNLKIKVIKQICQRLEECINNPNIKIDYRVILETKENQVKKLINNFIINANSINNEKVNEIKSLFSKEEYLDEQVRVYFVIANYYLKNLKKIDISEKFFRDVFTLSLSSGNFKFIFPTTLQLTRLYNERGDIEDSISLYYKISSKLHGAPLILKGCILYNFALAFHMNNNIEKASNLYQRAIPYLTSTKYIDYIKNNLSICYGMSNENEKSNEILFELIVETTNDIKKAQYYGNILTNFIILKNENSVKIIILKLENILKILEKKKLLKPQSYACLGKAYIYLKDRFNAMKAFEKELSLGIKSKEDHFLITQYEYCIEQLCNIYVETEIGKFKQLEKYVLVIPNDMFNEKFFFKFLNKLANVYSREDYIAFTEKLKLKYSDI